MARQNHSQTINAALAIMGELTELVQSTLEIYCPGSEAAQERAKTLRLMVAGLMNTRAGFPVADDIIEQPQSEGA